MIYSYMSDKGIVRDNNEDFILVDEHKSIFIIADGMGGYNAGEVASTEASTCVYKHLIQDEQIEKTEDLETLFKESFKIANQKLLDMVKEDTKLFGMGTTLLLFFVREDIYHILNLGDSRAYLVKNNKIIPITKDHSLVQEMIDDGLINENEAKSHKYRNIITQSLGMDVPINPEYLSGKLSKDEKILLCTDGLYDYVDKEDIEQIILNNSIEESIKLLIDKANENGGRDNCSVIIFSLSSS